MFKNLKAIQKLSSAKSLYKNIKISSHKSYQKLIISSYIRQFSNSENNAKEKAKEKVKNIPNIFEFVGGSGLSTIHDQKFDDSPYQYENDKSSKVPKS